MNREEFNKLLENLKLTCDEEKFTLLEKYANFLIEYNKHTNLTSITNKQDIYLKHFYDSLTISSVIDFTKVTNLLDIGSGAGFPGLVLKIFFPNLNITLLDSNNKKITFLNEAIELLNLKSISCVQKRAEELTKEKGNFYDVVTARAVANYRILTEISLPLVKPNGYFIAMKGNAESEIKESLTTINKMDAKIIQKEEFLLPIENSTRTIIKVQKNSLTDLTKLREYNKIIKTPLK